MGLRLGKSLSPETLLLAPANPDEENLGERDGTWSRGPCQGQGEHTQQAPRFLVFRARGWLEGDLHPCVQVEARQAARHIVEGGKKRLQRGAGWRWTGTARESTASATFPLLLHRRSRTETFLFIPPHLMPRKQTWRALSAGLPLDSLFISNRLPFVCMPACLLLVSIFHSALPSRSASIRSPARRRLPASRRWPDCLSRCGLQGLYMQLAFRIASLRPLGLAKQRLS